MSNLKIIILFGIFILISVNVAALTVVEIDVKPSFSSGDVIEFDYKFIPKIPQKIDYVASVKCPKAPQALLQLKTLDLKVNSSYLETYTYLTIDDSIEPQTCMAQVSIIEPYELTIEKEFEILADPSFSFKITHNKKVFLLNEEIFLSYASSIRNPTILATLTFPDKSTSQITLPTSINVSQVGIYTLEVKASKKGYKRMKDSIQWGVLEKDVHP